MIRQVLPGGVTLGNVTVYSPTTTRHQTMCGVRSCDVLLDSVPRGCSDLEVLAIERTLISPIRWTKVGGHYIPEGYHVVDKVGV